MSRRKSRNTFELFFSPRFPMLFLAGAMLVAVMGNMASDLLKSYFGDAPPRLWVIFVISSVLLFLLVAAIYAAGVFRAMFTSRSVYRFLDKPNPAPRKGLIAFVSLTQRAHLDRAVLYHRETLERLWLITTQECQVRAAQLVAEYKKNGVQVSVVPLSEEWDLIQAKETVDRIYAEQLNGIAEEDIIADFTGGTKPMTVGMVFACLTPSRSLQYVPAEYDKDRGMVPHDPIEYKFDARMIGILAGGTE
jgi:CRISPR-associated protein (Cas_Cas02710)